MNLLEDNGEVAVKATEISARGAVFRDDSHVPTTGASRDGGVTTGADHV